MSIDELIRGCSKGKALHQQKLVERFAPMLLTIARRYMGNDADAQDVLQDSFVKILRSLQKNYTEQGKLEQWMRTIVITTALNAMNKATVKYEESIDHTLHTAVSSPDAYDNLGAEELLALVAALPDGYRQIFNLAVIENYTHLEIAALLNISESTSRSQLARARKLLQEKIIELEKIRL